MSKLLVKFQAEVGFVGNRAITVGPEILKAAAQVLGKMINQNLQDPKNGLMLTIKEAKVEVQEVKIKAQLPLPEPTRKQMERIPSREYIQSLPMGSLERKEARERRNKMLLSRGDY